MVSHRSLTQIFGAPLVIAVVSTVGLISALVGDGWWDAVSWAGLGLLGSLLGPWVISTSRRRSTTSTLRRILATRTR